jgi:RNA polymerase sigma factor (sigma-70 family)
MSSFHDCIEDKKTLMPESILENKEEKSDLQDLVQQLFDIEYLSERQKDFIRLYYFENYTLEKIGKKYNITREAVRQGLNKAINLLKDVVS